MKFVIERGPLHKSLAHIARVVERRNTYPILANVLISADAGGGITMRATDLDIEITESVPASVSEPGVTTVPAATLSEIIRKMPDGCEVSFEVKDGQAVIKAGRSRFTLGCLDAETFPDLKSGVFTHGFEVPAKDFARIIAKTEFAISHEETRYYLNGIFLHTIEVGRREVLRGVATDGHRMGRCEVAAPDGAAGMPGIIIPKKTVGELSKLLDGVDGNVPVEISSTKIRVTLGGVVLLSKLIEGTFPDYERVTPKNNNKIVAVSKTELALATDRVSIVASDRGGKAVKLAFEEEVLTLEVTNADHGTATEDITVSSGIGAFEIGFNARYLLDVVGQIDSGDVQFMFNDAGSPTLISDPSDESALYVLMPMRV